MDGTAEQSNIASSKSEDRYLQLLIDALSVCAQYKPKLGMRGAGQSLEQFQNLYSADPFYDWVGLDSPLMYAAHKAAGGMTSIYRQLGIGCQRIFSQVLQDQLGLSSIEAGWNYQMPTSTGQSRTLSLDGRIELAHVQDSAAKARVEEWLARVGERLLLPDELRERIKGAVFEVRQGYKSMDSKRQNADITNATNAYIHSYVPVLLLFSTQIDPLLATRYSQAKWLLLVGTTTGQGTKSTYAFCREVLGYDLARFFQENSAHIHSAVEDVLTALLEP